MKGFTFIELIIVLAIIALLAAVGVAAANRALMQARDAKRASVMHDVQNALGYYNVRNSGYFNSTNDFCGLISALVPDYLPVAPVDPKTQTTICGVGNSYIGGAMYNYTATPAAGTASSYVLTLVKESGGRADFYSPQ